MEKWILGSRWLGITISNSHRCTKPSECLAYGAHTLVCEKGFLQTVKALSNSWNISKRQLVKIEVWRSAGSWKPVGNWLKCIIWHILFEELLIWHTNELIELITIKLHPSVSTFCREKQRYYITTPSSSPHFLIFWNNKLWNSPWLALP